MKKIFYFVMCIALSFSLYGCAQGRPENLPATASTQPLQHENNTSNASTQVMQHDLNASLLEYMNYELHITDFSIDRSLSLEKSYTGTASVSASAKYSDIEFEADFSYTNYDQGWAMDSCTWNLIDYQITAYPDEEKMNQLKVQNSLDSLLPLTLEAPSSYGENFVTCIDQISVNWSSIVNATGNIVTTWMYDIKYDDWFFYSQDTSDYTYILTDKLTGQYQLYADTSSGVIHISNVTDSGFDIIIDDEYYTTDTFHVEFESGSMHYENGYFCLNYTNPNTVFYTTNKTVYSGEALIQLYIYNSIDHMAGDYNVRCLINIYGTNDKQQELIAASMAHFVAN